MDVNKALKSMVNNPFELEIFGKINNTDISFDEEVYNHLAQLCQKGQETFPKVWEERLRSGKVAISNPFIYLFLPGKFEDDLKKKGKKLPYPRNILTKLRSAVHHRRELATKIYLNYLVFLSVLL